MSQEIDMTNDVQPASGAFTLTKQDNGVAILTMDVPGESMIRLKPNLVMKFHRCLMTLMATAVLKGWC